MSCCGFPPASPEPLYPMPAPLLGFLQDWETRCPGVLQSVALTIGNGNYDKMGTQEAGHVPPYTLSEACAVALEELERALLAQDKTRALRDGPWWVRAGLKTYVPTLDATTRAYLETQRQALAHLG